MRYHRIHQSDQLICTEKIEMSSKKYFPAKKYFSLISDKKRQVQRLYCISYMYVY